MRLSRCTTPQQCAAFEKEWAAYQLMGLPKEHDSILTMLTTRQSEGEGPSRVTVVAPVDSRLRYWARYLAGNYPLLASAARRLLLLHVTTCSCERNWSLWGTTYTKARNALAIERAEKLIYIKANGGQGNSKDDQEVLLEVLGEDE
jgi:hypothetical protein